MARSKAYLFAGVEWKCGGAFRNNGDIPAGATVYYPGGLGDYLNDATKDKAIMISPLAGRTEQGAKI